MAAYWVPAVEVLNRLKSASRPTTSPNTPPMFSAEYARPAWNRQLVSVRTAVVEVPIAADWEMDEATWTPSLRVMKVFTVVAYVLMSAARFPMSVGMSTADVLAG